MSILNVEHLTHGFGDRAIFSDVSFRLLKQAKVRLCKLINRDTNILLLDEPTNHLDVDAKDSLKKALQEYRGSILLICHEPEFYQDVVNEVWDMSKWTTKVF